MEERQKRAEKDELSTVEMPLFILDNVSTTKKIAEFNRTTHHKFQDMAVKREDIRVQVKQIFPLSSFSDIIINTNKYPRARCLMIE